MNKPSQKLKAVRNVKEKLANVNVVEVAKEMKCSRQNIYYHLHEERAEAVNLEILQMISTAIDKVIAANKKKEQKQIQSIV